MTGQGTETGRNALAGLPAVQSRRLHRNRLYRRGERTFSSLGRRTSATLQDDTAWHYTYNQRSEITSAIRKNASNVTQNTMRYVFDNIGNRTSSYEDATSKTYDANCLNQYTEIDVTGGSSVCPLYDDDGNMTQFDSSTYTYDAENRLVGAQNGTTRLEFIYDALGRRVARKLYLNNTLSKHHRYVYDGMKLLATYNAKSSFAKINSFLWQPFGLDVPLIMSYNSTVYGYLVDANKNVLGLFNPSKTRVATYLYGPFGQKLSESGTIAANNPLQFSSEQFDADLGLIYYNYRYYLPAIGKWLTKDPIGEEGGWNLYVFCENNAVNTWDVNGEFEWGEIWDDFTYKVGHAVEAVDDAIGGHFEDISNFAAGASDSLTMDLTYMLRSGFGINNTINTQSKSYFAGVITETVVEISLTMGSGWLRKRAAKVTRYKIKATTRQAKKALNINPETKVPGQIHHKNPVKDGRYPLPFEFATKKWNLKIIEGPSRGLNMEHKKIHDHLKRLDKIDIFRAKTQLFRNPVSILQSVLSRFFNNDTSDCNCSEQERK